MNHSVVEINLGEIACGLCLRHSSNGSSALTCENSDALSLGFYRRRSSRHSSLGSQ